MSKENIGKFVNSLQTSSYTFLFPQKTSTVIQNGPAFLDLIFFTFSPRVDKLYL